MNPVIRWYMLVKWIALSAWDRAENRELVRLPRRLRQVLADPNTRDVRPDRSKLSRNVRRSLRLHVERVVLRCAPVQHDHDAGCAEGSSALRSLRPQAVTESESAERAHLEHLPAAPDAPRRPSVIAPSSHHALTSLECRFPERAGSCRMGLQT